MRLRKPKQESNTQHLHNCLGIRLQAKLLWVKNPHSEESNYGLVIR